MATKTLKPSLAFIKLYEKAEKARLSVPQSLSKMTNYNTEWCRKNMAKATASITEDQMREIEGKFLWAQIISSKMWANFYFENFEEVRDYLKIPDLINYDPKTKKVTLQDPNELLFKMKKYISEFKGKIEKLHRPLNSNKTKPPIGL